MRVEEFEELLKENNSPEGEVEVVVSEFRNVYGNPLGFKATVSLDGKYGTMYETVEEIIRIKGVPEKNPRSYRVKRELFSNDPMLSTMIKRIEEGTIGEVRREIKPPVYFMGVDHSEELHPQNNDN